MKRPCLITITFILVCIKCYSQLDIKTIHLEDFLSASDSMTHTLKVEVINNCNNSTLIYLRNRQDITGIKIPKYSYKSPFIILTEYGGSIYVEPQSWRPTPFFTWFKELAPDQKFTFYFQYHTDEINEKGLIQLIRHWSVCGYRKAIDDLGWKDDEIFICLPI